MELYLIWTCGLGLIILFGKKCVRKCVLNPNSNPNLNPKYLNIHGSQRRLAMHC